MNVTELEKKNIGQRATVTFPLSGPDDSFTGVITDISHSNHPAPRSSAIIDVNGQSMVVMSIAESVKGPAVIRILSD